ncbi:cytochrome c biogenesis protein ResB [Alkaliphilus sp. MSJ-5]|uniref:Cytochrome c biogenesis protein ResB n=1 Tax=Alkaliphilus flagellatus TaxID=2841507 RepID=A0ABS6G6V0_9FIRM|nr:cytochrome c biogenesis protein ResB [Alkaliphilus flagellatus]MBU5678217.1 cytochrome c biogenesis protein ResB [Alkaliphilus flagellatus]
MKQDSIFKEIWKAFHSMKFGIILLIIISISSIAGTVIPQNNPMTFYEKEYSFFIYTIISTLSLHKVYASWWFISMMVALSINLTLCSIIRLPVIIRQISRKPQLEEEIRGKNFLIKSEFDKEIDVEKFFKRTRFFRVKRIDKAEGTYYFSQKNSFGYLGSWLSHVGLLIIISSYIFGKIVGFETYAYGVPGTVHSIEGTSYTLNIDDFNIDFREDHTVNQYISNITVKNQGGDVVKTGNVMVNHPFRMEEINIYQNGTGWAIDIELEKNEKKISERTLYQSEVHVDDNERIALQFVNFYPDFDQSKGMPRTLTPYLNNPKLLYTIFYEGQRVDMNVASIGEDISWEEYTFKIHNPRQFTLLQIVSDPGMTGATVGGLILLLGIMLAFYFHPKQLKAFESKDGRTVIWGDTAKNKDVFKEEMKLALMEIE